MAQAHAHEGSIFALCLRRDGTVLSGGGRDRRLVQWGPGLVALQEAEVRARLGSREGGGGGMASGPEFLPLLCRFLNTLEPCGPLLRGWALSC